MYTPTAKLVRAPRATVRPDPLDAQLADLLASVMTCERNARRTPLTWASAVLPRKRS